MGGPGVEVETKHHSWLGSRGGFVNWVGLVCGTKRHSTIWRKQTKEHTWGSGSDACIGEKLEASGFGGKGELEHLSTMPRRQEEMQEKQEILKRAKLKGPKPGGIGRMEKEHKEIVTEAKAVGTKAARGGTAAPTQNASAGISPFEALTLPNTLWLALEPPFYNGK